MLLHVLSVRGEKPEDIWARVLPTLDEAHRRWVAGAKALDLGRGGITQVRALSGLSFDTIRRGIQEIRSDHFPPVADRVRRPGAGRKPLEITDPGVLPALKALLQDATAGDPMSSLLWTHRSSRRLAEELSRQGHPVSYDTVIRLLQQLGYSLQVNAKSKEGRSPPERDAQFRHINEEVAVFQAAGNPVLSVDTKKKEKVGLFKNAGRTYRPSGDPVEVNVYDFPRLSKGTAVPYGVYDLDRNRGFVNVGMDHETTAFAVESLRWWWRRYGQRWYPQATGWLICADGGGSNGSNKRGWKYHLHELARDLGIRVTVCHYPPGTSKWNAIEHRLFSFISRNWQGVPLESYETVVSLIMATKTKKGLKVGARLDERKYPLKEKITDEQMAEIHIEHHEVNPEWNYTIYPTGSPTGKKKARAKG